MWMPFTESILKPLGRAKNGGLNHVTAELYEDEYDQAIFRVGLPEALGFSLIGFFSTGIWYGAAVEAVGLGAVYSGVLDQFEGNLGIANDQEFVLVHILATIATLWGTSKGYSKAQSGTLQEAARVVEEYD
jgi:hypothetical protein